MQDIGRTKESKRRQNKKTNIEENGLMGMNKGCMRKENGVGGINHNQPNQHLQDLVAPTLNRGNLIYTSFCLFLSSL